MAESLVENLNRKDLTEDERDGALKTLRDRFGWSEEKIGNTIGRRRQWVSDRIRAYEYRMSSGGQIYLTEQ